MKVREIHTDAITGETTERWIEIPGVLTIEEAQAAEAAERCAEARQERDLRLSACDWTTLPDVPLSDAQRALWAIYRQALRDVTGQAGFPVSITWPDAP